MDLRELHARRRLVEQQQLRVRGESPGDLQSSLVGERQRPGQVAASVGETDEVQEAPRPLTQPALAAPHGRRQEQRPHEPDM